MSTASTSTTTGSGQKVKTPLKKEELEKIARQLKKEVIKGKYNS